MQFKVPQDVQRADKIVGPLSLTQLIICIVGGGLSYAIFTSLNKQGVSAIFWLPPVAIIVLITVSFAFLRIANLPFYKYLALLTERLMVPSKRTWVKGADRVISTEIEPTKQEQKDIQKKQQEEEQKIEKEEAFKKIEEITSALNTGEEKTTEIQTPPDEKKQKLEELIGQIAPKEETHEKPKQPEPTPEPQPESRIQPVSTTEQEPEKIAMPSWLMEKSQEQQAQQTDETPAPQPPDEPTPAEPAPATVEPTPQPEDGTVELPEEQKPIEPAQETPIEPPTPTTLPPEPLSSIQTTSTEPEPIAPPQAEPAPDQPTPNTEPTHPVGPPTDTQPSNSGEITSEQLKQGHEVQLNPNNT